MVTSKVKPLTGLAQFDVDIGTRRGYRLWGSDGILLLDAPRPHGATSDTKYKGLNVCGTENDRRRTTLASFPQDRNLVDTE